MNWPDGFVQVSWIDAGMTQGLDGAIGTSGFPTTIDVLTEECEPVASVVGLPPGSTGIVVIAAVDTRLHRLESADASWGTVGSLDACGATRRDRPAQGLDSPRRVDSLDPSAEAEPRGLTRAG